MNPDYVALYIGSSSAQTWLADNAVGGTMPNLNTRILSALPIHLPPKSQQDEIVLALETAASIVGGITKLIDKKQSVRTALLRRLIPSASAASDEQTLGTLTTFLSGGTPNRANPDYWSGTIPWISATTMKSVEVATSDQHVTRHAVTAGSKMAPLGSTLLLVRGSALHSEIRASLVVRPVCFNQDVKALVPAASVVPKFLTYSIHATAERLLRLVSSAGRKHGRRP